MRKLILSMCISLDGFIEGPDADIKWIKTNDVEQWSDLFTMLDHVDLLLLGRVMYPDYRDYWKKCLTSSDATTEEKRYAKYAEQTPHIVFSKTMKEPGWANTKVFDGDVISEVTRLKKLPGKDIQIVGGAMLAASLIKADLVDEYRLMLHPVIVAGGKSFLHEMTTKRDLELIESISLQSGVVILVYRSMAT